MSDLFAPAIILVKPQLAENIGTAARAMHNGALTDLRLVRPFCGWPNTGAIQPAKGGHVLLNDVQVFENTASSLAEFHVVYATTARSRDMTKRVITPRKAAEEMVAHAKARQKVGILFGPERTGLTNDDISRAQVLINVPLNPNYTSLNLAQAVLILAYEWFQVAHAGQINDEKIQLRNPDQDQMASQHMLENMYTHLEQALEDSGFLRVTEKRQGMMQNIRNMFARHPMTEQEIRTFRGILTALTQFKK